MARQRVSSRSWPVRRIACLQASPHLSAASAMVPRAEVAQLTAQPSLHRPCGWWPRGSVALARCRISARGSGSKHTAWLFVREPRRAQHVFAATLTATTMWETSAAGPVVVSPSASARNLSTCRLRRGALVAIHPRSTTPCPITLVRWPAARARPSFPQAPALVATAGPATARSSADGRAQRPRARRRLARVGLPPRPTLRRARHLHGRKILASGHHRPQLLDALPS